MRLLTPARPGRPVVVTVAVAGAALLLGGCSFWSPDVTLEPYAPADGLQGELGDVLVRNVLVVSPGGGEDGLLVAALSNRGEEDAEVAIEVAGVPAGQFDVPAGEVLQFSRPDADGLEGIGPQQQTETLVLEGVESLPGNVVEVRFTDAVSGSVALDVPILLPAGYYQDYLP